MFDESPAPHHPTSDAHFLSADFTDYADLAEKYIVRQLVAVSVYFQLLKGRLNNGKLLISTLISDATLSVSGLPVTVLEIEIIPYKDSFMCFVIHYNI
jgi:hypothetical protein